MIRVRLRKWGRDHIADDKRRVTACGLNYVPKETKPVRGGIVCVTCRRRFREAFGSTPPGYPGS